MLDFHVLGDGASSSSDQLHVRLDDQTLARVVARVHEDERVGHRAGLAVLHGRLHRLDVDHIRGACAAGRRRRRLARLPAGPHVDAVAELAEALLPGVLQLTVVGADELEPRTAPGAAAAGRTRTRSGTGFSCGAEEAQTLDARGDEVIIIEYFFNSCRSFKAL